MLGTWDKYLETYICYACLKETNIDDADIAQSRVYKNISMITGHTLKSTNRQKIVNKWNVVNS